MDFYSGKIENHLYVIDDTNNIQYWEISIAETQTGSAKRIVRFGAAINRETGLSIGWKQFSSAKDNEEVYDQLVTEILGDIQV
jgi:hypothetical protein